MNGCIDDAYHGHIEAGFQRKIYVSDTSGNMIYDMIWYDI
jgi:hypothetical protein